MSRLLVGIALLLLAGAAAWATVIYCDYAWRVSDETASGIPTPRAFDVALQALCVAPSLLLITLSLLIAGAYFAFGGRGERDSRRDPREM